MKGYLKIAVIITICSWLLWTLCHLFGIDYDIALIELMLNGDDPEKRIAAYLERTRY